MTYYLCYKECTDDKQILTYRPVCSYRIPLAGSTEKTEWEKWELWKLNWILTSERSKERVHEGKYICTSTFYFPILTVGNISLCGIFNIYTFMLSGKILENSYFKDDSPSAKKLTFFQQDFHDLCERVLHHFQDNLSSHFISFLRNMFISELHRQAQVERVFCSL